MLELHMRVHNYNIFLHDSAPCHRSKVMTNFLEQKRIQRLEWPGNSLDLDPIKNLWNFMKNKVSEKHPSSLDALQTAIELVWVRVLQFVRWCCVDCVIHHERDVREEQHHTYMWREQAIIE